MIFSFYYLLTEEEQKWDQVIEPLELPFHHPRRSHRFIDDICEKSWIPIFLKY